MIKSIPRIGDINIDDTKASLDFYEDGLKKIHDMMMIDPIMSVYFRKFKDDWYLVQICEGDDQNEGDDPTGYTHYLCDQFDGFRDMVEIIRFKDILKEKKPNIIKKIKKFFGVNL
jgi:hypothetical protein